MDQGQILKLLENNLLNRALIARLSYPDLAGSSSAKAKLSRQIKRKQPFTAEQLTEVLPVLESLYNELKTALNKD